MRALQRSALVPPELEGERLDRALALLVPELSRRLAKTVIAMGGVRVGKKCIRRASFPLRTGDVLAATWHPNVLEPERFPLEVLSDDGDILVLHKPSGQLSQGSELGDVGSLIHSLQRAYGRDVRLLHRLDKGVSGLLLAARQKDTVAYLGGLFREQAIERGYLALVEGLAPTGRLAHALMHEGRHHRIAFPLEKGEEAITHVRHREQGKDEALLWLSLETGKTHQLRLHLSHHDAPILGDSRYGGKKRGRILLHSAYLSFVSERGELRRFHCPPPASFWEEAGGDWQAIYEKKEDGPWQGEVERDGQG